MSCPSPRRLAWATNTVAGTSTKLLNDWVAVVNVDMSELAEVTYMKTNRQIQWKILRYAHRHGWSQHQYWMKLKSGHLIEWETHHRSTEVWHTLSNDFTVASADPHVYLPMKWTMALEAVLCPARFTNPVEIRKAESTELADYIPRWFTCPQMVTHSITNRAQCWLTHWIDQCTKTGWSAVITFHQAYDYFLSHRTSLLVEMYQIGDKTCFTLSGRIETWILVKSHACSKIHGKIVQSLHSGYQDIHRTCFIHQH